MGKHSRQVGECGPTPRRGVGVVCMANPRRVAKVQQQMRREISNMMQTDQARASQSSTRPLMPPTLPSLCFFN